MSLWLVDKTYDPPLELAAGWKVLTRSERGLRFPHFPLCTPVPCDTWLKAERKMAPTIRGERYETGFHVFTSYQDAKTWCDRPSTEVYLVVVKKVRLHGLHAREGRHRDVPTLEVLVADEMMVLSPKHTATREMLLGWQTAEGTYPGPPSERAPSLGCPDPKEPTPHA